MVVLPLILAFLAVNLLHGYLLVSQRLNRQQTISEHAAKSSRTHTIYILGHFLGAIFFVIFVRQFFYLKHGSDNTLIIASIGAVAECLQALIPARGKYKKYHELFAYCMSLAVATIGFMAAFVVPLTLPVGLACLAMAGVLAVFIVLVGVVNRKYFWIVQMVAVQVFYLEMFTIVIANRN